MISIKKNPSILINGQKSNWFPAHQPITFEMQRVDATVLQKYNVGGTEIHFKLNKTIPTSVITGQKVYYIQGIYSKILTVKSVSGNYLKVAYDSSLLGGSNGIFIFIDAYKGHYIETKVSFINGSTYETIGSIKNKTDNFGIARVSVQELLSTKTINQNNFLYDAINKHQFGEGSKFNIQIREVFNGVAGNYTSLTDANVLYYTNSSNQIQDKYGYNMGSYVPTFDNARTDKAKFQSVFNRPTYFVGYPFSLNFIYSDNMLNYQVIRKETTKDINGITIATTTDNLNMNSRLYANRLMLKQVYTSNVKTIDVSLEADETLPVPVMWDNDLYSEGYSRRYLPNPVFLNPGSATYSKSLYE